MKGIQLKQELMLDLLQMKEITTTRQQKNGTRIFQLPIKKYGQYIEVGSFESGYVRRMNGGYTPYQLNKCEKYDHYYKLYDYSNDNSPKFNGNYRKHECVKRILIPNEVDRLEYLIAFCLKNYYINQANMIEEGKFVPKWKYDMKNRYTWSCGQITDNENGDIYVHNQHAYWNKWQEDKPSSVEIIIDGHRYKVK